MAEKQKSRARGKEISMIKTSAWDTNNSKKADKIQKPLPMNN